MVIGFVQWSWSVSEGSAPHKADEFDIPLYVYMVAAFSVAKQTFNIQWKIQAVVDYNYSLLCFWDCIAICSIFIYVTFECTLLSTFKLMQRRWSVVCQNAKREVIVCCDNTGPVSLILLWAGN